MSPRKSEWTRIAFWHQIPCLNIFSRLYMPQGPTSFFFISEYFLSNLVIWPPKWNKQEAPSAEHRAVTEAERNQNHWPASIRSSSKVSAWLTLKSRSCQADCSIWTMTQLPLSLQWDVKTPRNSRMDNAQVLWLRWCRVCIYLHVISPVL